MFKQTTVGDFYNLFISFFSLVGTIWTLSQVIFISVKEAYNTKRIAYTSCKDAIVIKQKATTHRGLSVMILAFLNQFIFITKEVDNWGRLVEVLAINIILFCVCSVTIGLRYNTELKKCILSGKEERRRVTEGNHLREIPKELVNNGEVEEISKVMQRLEEAKKYPYEKMLYKYFKICRFGWFFFAEDRRMVREVNEENQVEENL